MTDSRHLAYDQQAHIHHGVPFDRPESFLLDASWHRSGRYVAGISHDGTLRAWDILSE